MKPRRLLCAILVSLGQPVEKVLMFGHILAKLVGSCRPSQSIAHGLSLGIQRPERRFDCLTPCRYEWGFFNMVVGYLLVCRVGDFTLRSTTDVIDLGAGAFLISLFSARHFGRLNGGHAEGLS